MPVPMIISDNLAASISDHLPQSFEALNCFSNSSYSKSNRYEREWSKFYQQKFCTWLFLGWMGLSFVSIKHKY